MKLHKQYNKLSGYAEHYITTALWSSCDDKDQPLDDSYSENDLSDEAILKANKDVTEFVEKIEKLGLDLGDHETSQVMRDFWLTRNGHGAGFWDGDYEDVLGEALEKLLDRIKKQIYKQRFKNENN